MGPNPRLPSRHGHGRLGLAMRMEREDDSRTREGVALNVFNMTLSLAVLDL